MNNPLVSIIVPAYNGEDFLAAALESIFVQDYRPIEVFVVDDGSVDDTARIAQSFPEVRYIYQANRGTGAACNTGLAEAQGEFIAFLDHDDLWTQDKLSVQVGYLLDRPHVGYVIARMRTFLTPGTTRPPWIKEHWLVEDQVCFGLGALVARREVFAKIGDFDSCFRLCSDYDWLARASDAGIPMEILSETLLHRRVHDANQSHNMEGVRRQQFAVLKSSIANKSGKRMVRSGE